jgi:putative Mg2+ transporter-C (MgtC) family protein
MHSELELSLRLLAATVLTGLVGWERQTAGKSAGFRTHVLVGVASCLFATLGVSLSQDFAGSNVRIEPFSIIQAVAVGVGFLGSGIVIVRSDNRPHGLTTAASIWAASGIGLGTGFGKYILTSAATILLLIMLRGAEQLEQRYQSRQRSDGIAKE